MHHEKQQQAHALYFNTDKTQQEIADILDVNRRTIYLWIKQGRWAEMKTAARQMPSIIQQNLYNYINAVSDRINKREEDDRCPTMEEIEKMRKLLNMAGSIGRKHTGAYIEAFQELQLFIFNRDAALASQLREHIADYARGTIGDKDFMARKRRKDNVLDVVANLGRQELRERESRIENPGPVEGCHPERAEEEIFCDKITSAKQDLAEASFSSHSFSEGCSLPNTNRHPEHVEGRVECDTNGIFCDKIAPNVDDNSEPDDTPEPATVKDFKGDLSIAETAKYSVEHFAEHGIFLPGEVGNEAEDDPIHFERAMELPPHMRPSPYIVGDTVWIIHPDHLESRLDTYGNEWGPIKMNQTIRYYPDIDPANTQAA